MFFLTPETRKQLLNYLIKLMVYLGNLYTRFLAFARDFEDFDEPDSFDDMYGEDYRSLPHRFHMVTRSPWPLLLSFSILFVVFGFVGYMHGYRGGFMLFFSGVGLVSFLLMVWWRDVVREATFEGRHTGAVVRNHKLGFSLFIASEVMFFFAFFWAFFHSSLSPAIELGCVWPPAGILPFDPWKVPLLNTVILLLSGVTITLCHRYMIIRFEDDSLKHFRLTLFLAFLFTAVQLYEYRSSFFSISDSVYGSTFFMATGFHGLHVIVGSIFILVCFFRFLAGHFSNWHHIGFECAAWYWHFVDVVWLFLFAVVYWWGGLH